MALSYFISEIQRVIDHKSHILHNALFKLPRQAPWPLTTFSDLCGHFNYYCHISSKMALPFLNAKRCLKLFLYVSAKSKAILSSKLTVIHELISGRGGPIKILDFSANNSLRIVNHAMYMYAQLLRCDNKKS